MCINAIMRTAKKIIANEEVSSISWNLSVEALSEMKQIDTALIDGLLCKAPLDYDSLSSSAKERLSLRRLEDMFSTTTNVASISGSSVPNVAERAEDVYLRLHHEMEKSSSKAVILASSKVNVCQFILQKRACLSKCVLQQVEEALIQGGHPSIAYSREVGGLNKEHQVEVARKLNQIINGITILNPKACSTHVISENMDKLLQGSHTTLPNSSGNKETNERVVDGGTTAAHVNALTQNPKSSGFHLPNETTCLQIPENAIKIMQNVPTDNLVYDKRNKCQFTEKQSANCSNNGELNPMERNSDSPLVCRSFESRRGCASSSIHHEATGLANETHLLQENINSDDDVGEYENVVSKRIKRSVSEGQMDNYKPRSIHKNNKRPQKEPPDGSHGKKCANEAKSDGGNSAEDPNKASSFHFNLEATIVATESSILSSKMTLNEDSSDADWTETEICIVCNRGHQLLVCCVSTCQIAVHESCLGSSDVFDNTGNFYCPACLYSQAFTAYSELKKKAVQAKKMAASAKDRLYKFMNLVHRGKQKQPSELPSMEEFDQSRMVENVNFLDEVSAKGKQKDIANNQVNMSQGAAELEVSAKGKHKEVANNQAVLPRLCTPEAELPCVFSTTLHHRPCPSGIIDQDIAFITKEARQKQANNLGGKVLNNQECLEPSSELPSMDDQQHTDVGAENRDSLQEPVSSTVGPSTVFDGNDNAVAENADERQKVVNSPQRNSIQSDKNVEEVSEQDNANAVAENADERQKVVNSPQRNSIQSDTNVEEVSEQDNGNAVAENADERQKVVNSPQRNSIQSDTNVEEVSEQDNGNGRHNHGSRHVVARLPCRRKKTPWTPEEEEKLKEGVQKYANSDTQFPWKIILEFGQDVFQENRTAIDLKDKWRNMCKKGRLRTR